MADDLDIALGVEVNGVEQSINSIKDLKKALKDAKDEQLKMAEQFGIGSVQYERASRSISSLRDRMDDLNDSTRSLQGSGVERASEGFNQLGEGLRNLDFDKIKIGLTAMKSALAAVGIGLIVQAVMYLVENFDSLSKGSGILAKALRWVGDAIQSAIDVLYTLTDAIGITNSALDKMGDAIKTNADKAKEAISDQSAEYDRQIAVAKASGKNAIDLEIQKQKMIIETNKALAEQIKAYVASGGEFDAERRKQLKETLNSIANAANQIQVIELNAKKDSLEKEKTHTADLKKELDKRRSDYLDFILNKDLNQANYEEKSRQFANDLRKEQQASDLESTKIHFDEMSEADLQKQVEKNKKSAEQREKEKKEHEAFEKDKVNITSDATQKGLQSLQALSDLYFSYKRNSLAKGSKEELEAAKKQFKINKALQLTQATIQGVQGVMAAFSSGAAVPVVGAILGPVYAALAGIVAGANIAKIASAKFDENGGSTISPTTSGGSAPTVPIPQAPTLDTPSVNTNQNTSFDSDGRNTSNTITVNANIGVDEITNKQNRVNVLETQRTF